ncbi:MAG: biopolymer transporter ExbD [Alphaproteobacteria bacterium]|nr:biopolymer transporter ExbD [Alphaproteobacteria bacterium]
MAGGLDREDFSAPMAEINVTPMVDVMLVLLVIFLVTAPMLTQAVKLELPNEVATSIADENPITLSIDAKGQYFWGEEALTDTQLEQRLEAESHQPTKRPIHLRADTSVPYGKVNKVLALAQKHGLSQIGFVTEPK